MNTPLTNEGVMSVLNVLADCRAQFSARAIEWRRDERVARAYASLDIVRYVSGARLEISLDLEFRNDGTLSWILEIDWKGGSWKLNASVRESSEHGQEVAQELASETVGDVPSLIAALPRLTGALLAMTPPMPSRAPTEANPPAGGDAEAILEVLRKNGFSKVRSIQALVELKMASIDQAKGIVHRSEAWKDVRERDDAFQSSLDLERDEDRE